MSHDEPVDLDQLDPTESLKYHSSGLRGTIAEGLADEATGALSEDNTRLLKHHGSYQQDDRDLRAERSRQKLEPAYSFMIRVRMPGGVCTPTQWRQLDAVADDYANGTLRVTTRQTFQYHGVIKRNLKTTMQAINASLLDTIGACGDVHRNVNCGANPHLSSVHREIWEWSKRLSEHLLPDLPAYHEIWLDGEKVAGGIAPDPLYGRRYLPRKLKTAIAIPPMNDVDVYANDLGFIAIIDDGQLQGFNVVVGGGMGTTHGEPATYPRLAEPMGFCTRDQLLEVAWQVVAVQRDWGDRINRKHARLKYTIDDYGLDAFRTEVERRAGFTLQASRPVRFESNVDRYGWIEGEDGRWHLTLFVENGRLKDADGRNLRSALRAVADIHRGEFRLTANQNVVIANVSQDQRAAINDRLREHGIEPESDLSPLRRASMACVAFPTCGLAMAESERYLPSLLTRLEELMARHGLDNQAIVVRMTGCPNGCARPFLGEIGLVGKAPGKYNLYLGAGFHGQRLNRLYRENIGESPILAELEPLLAEYAREREAGEPFGDYVVRAGHVRPTRNGLDFHN